MTNGPEYLVSFGSAGDFSRFRAVPPATYERGDRVVVRSHQGLELGVVMCPVTVSHTHYLSERAMGELLRRVTSDDERTAMRMRAWGDRLFAEASQLALELRLPLEVLDVEVLLDGKRALIHHLRRAECDYRPLVSTLSRKHDLLLILQNLALPAELAEDEPGSGCGRPDCGHGNGGCATCQTGGGCSSGSCGAGVRKEEVAAYLAGLRQKMEARVRRPLL